MRLRLLLLAGTACALVTGGPALAFRAPDPNGPGVSAARSASALALLERAASVARTHSWRGVQSVLSTRGELPRLQLLRVTHTPGAGTVVDGLADSAHAVAPDLLDDDLFALLTRHYDLTVAGAPVLAGRRTLLVEARRPGETGRAAVAGRFWIDRATSMVWRRDVLDEDGTTALSSCFSELTMTRTAPVARVAPAASTGTRLDDRDVADLVDDGWPLVDHLPAGLDRFEAVRHPDGVVQMSYSDGLSTLSLFVQQGRPPEHTGGTLHEIGGNLVQVTGTSPEQLVWYGGGRTWTLVSDAPDSTIDEAVLVLPHTDPPVPDEGMGERVWRGMSRVGSWLNPFA